MSVTERPLTVEELQNIVTAKRRHAVECKHAHREDCVTLTWAEIDALLEAMPRGDE